MIISQYIYFPLNFIFFSFFFSSFQPNHSLLINNASNLILSQTYSIRYFLVNFCNKYYLIITLNTSNINNILPYLMIPTKQILSETKKFNYQTERYTTQTVNSLFLAEAALLMCGSASVMICTYNFVSDIQHFVKDKQLVKFTVNSSLVIGSTLMGAAVGVGMHSMAGLCLGALIGSLIGTGIKRLGVFGFKQ